MCQMMAGWQFKHCIQSVGKQYALVGAFAQTFLPAWCGFRNKVMPSAGGPAKQYSTS